MKHPMQYQVFDIKGVKRFTENTLITWLIDQLPGGLNSLSLEHQENNHDDDDYDQILQLIGYSVSEIPYRDKGKYDITDFQKNPEEVFEEVYKDLKNNLKPILFALFDIHEDDLK